LRHAQSDLEVHCPRLHLGHSRPHGFSHEEKRRLKRIFLFLVTNIAILLVLSVTLRLLGVDRILNAQGTGLDYNSLLIMAAVIGFGGSFVSLLMSKWMAKMATGAHVIEAPSTNTERWLVATVQKHAQRAGISMPEVAVYDAPEINAFATGWNKDAAL